LIVREPWEAVIEPVQIYVAVVGVVVLIVLLSSALLLWRGQQRIVTPVRSLVAQSRKLAAGEKTEPIPLGGILEIDMLTQAFDQMADRIESYRSGLRRYVGAMTISQEEERRRIARELHDETIQNLVAILRNIELLHTQLENPDDQSRLQDLQTLAEETMRGVRQISRNLRPPALEDLGFVPALRAQVEMTRRDGLNTKLRIIGEQRDLPPDQELALYRIAQEALTNARKHARAKLVQVKLTFGESSVQMVIADDGVGFDAPNSLTEWAQMGSFGLMGIQERAWGIGGFLEISSDPDKGTVLRVEIPATETNGQSKPSS
jgi:signal transduction histidine kinase